MNDFIFWSLVIVAGFMLTVIVMVVSEIIYAFIWDWNFRRKYGAWLALQDDYNKPKRPLAK